MHSIGSRLKVWRESLSLKQAEAASAIGLSASTYQNYERDVRAPNTEGWEAFVRAGINANWLLAGHGPMLFDDLLEDAKKTRQSVAEPVSEARKKIVVHALARVPTHWFVTSPGEAGQALNPVVDDYNAGRIFQFDEVRDEIPSITIEELMKWGRDLMRQPSATHQPMTSTEPRAGYIALPLYNDVRAAAGHGAVNGHEQADDALMFKEDWIRYELGAKAQDLCLIRVSGDSMEPTLRAGDVILIDHRACRPDREGIYIMRVGEMLLVKRLQALPGGKIRVTSDNPAFDPWTLGPEEFGADVQVVGRVVWSGRRL